MWRVLDRAPPGRVVSLSVNDTDADCSARCCADAACAAFQYYGEEALCGALLLGTGRSARKCCALLTVEPSADAPARPGQSSAGIVGEGINLADARLQLLGLILGAVAAGSAVVLLALAALGSLVVFVRRAVVRRRRPSAVLPRASASGDARGANREIALSGTSKQSLLEGDVGPAERPRAWSGYASIGGEYRTG